MYSKSSVQKVKVILKLAAWLVCILQEKVEGGLAAVQPNVQRIAVLVLATLNMVLKHPNCGTVAMDQFS